MKSRKLAGQMLVEMEERGERRTSGGDYTSKHGSLKEPSWPIAAKASLADLKASGDYDRTVGEVTARVGSALGSSREPKFLVGGASRGSTTEPRASETTASC